MSKKRVIESIEELSIECTRDLYSLLLEKVKDRSDCHTVMYYTSVFLVSKVVAGNGYLDKLTADHNLSSFCKDVDVVLQEHYKIKKPKHRMDA